MPRGGKQPGAGRPKGALNRKTVALRRALKRADDLTAARVLEEYRCLGFSDVGALFDAKGRLRPLKDLPRDVRAAIASVKVTKKNLTVGDGAMDDVVEVKLWDKTRVLNDLAKHFALLVEKVEHSGTVTLEQLVAGATADVPR
jgi:phage terminase small subunit